MTGRKWWLEQLELRTEIEAIADDLTKPASGAFDARAEGASHPDW